MTPDLTRLRRGATVRCFVPEPHDRHIWTAQGFPYPLVCNGEQVDDDPRDDS